MRVESIIPGRGCAAGEHRGPTRSASSVVLLPLPSISMKFCCLKFRSSKFELRTVGGGSLVFLPLIFPFFSAKNKLVRVALKML